MNEERKPKKLNIKKIAVVTLSVIMIMATFCLSAFADNPLTGSSTFILKETGIAIFDPTFTVSSGSYTEPITHENNTITVTLQDSGGNEFTITQLKILTRSNQIELASGAQDKTIIKYSKTEYDFWELSEDNQYTIISANDSTIEYSAEETAEILNDGITKLLTQTQNINIQDMFSNVRVTEVTKSGILSTFLGIGTWIGGAVSALIGMFYLNGSLTFIGYLAVAALAVSVVFLLIYLISSFLKFRG